MATFLNGKLKVKMGDITREKVDILVNTASEDLLVGAGGVNASVHRVAGADLVEECKKLAPLQTGEAVMTDSYRIRSTKIVHVVGPTWQGGEAAEEEALARCYFNVMSIVLKHNCEKVSFPVISAGHRNYPYEAACRVALKILVPIIHENDSLKRIFFFCRTSSKTTIMERVTAEYAG